MARGIRSSRRGLWSLISLVLLCVSWGQVSAQAPSLAPLNPEFSGEAVRSLGQNYGYRPSPVDWSHLQSAFRFPTRVIFPASYDLRSQGRVTAVRQQGASGSCWAFSTFASLESCLLPGETDDFSENNLKNTSGFDLDPNTGGGNRDMSTAYLARWGGPVYETDDPFSQTGTTSPSGLTARKHLQQVAYLPERTGPTDNTAIKQALMSYGAVMTLYYANDSYFNPSTAAYYNPSTHSVNHAVAIVGWDDNYNASNFATAPPGNGAFLIKNSWGSGWGQSGYFHISYYEPTLIQNTVYYTAEVASNYTRCYQYDTLGMTSNTGYGSTTGWLANIFTAAANEQIAAVSTFALTPNTTYQVSIYVNPTNGPLGGTPVVTQNGAFTDAGYHTVTLSSPVSVSAGQKFSVVMKLIATGYNYPIPIERPINGYSTKATASAGQSYISANGTAWSDVTTSYANTNVCLKAFAVSGGSSGSTLTAVGLSAGPASSQVTGTAITLTATQTGGSTVMYKFEAGLNGSWSTVQDYATDAIATWTPVAAGAYSVRVSAYDTDAPATVVTKTLLYTITAPLSAASLTTALTSPQALGQTIRLTAAATGGSSVQYQFSASSDSGSTWTVLQDYGARTYLDWTPGVSGSYLLKAAVREGATGTPVESSAVAYIIAAAPPTDVTLAASPASPQPANTAVTLTATRTGGGATVQYQFKVSNNSGASYTTIRDFDTAATVSWTPQIAGTYLLLVTAREPALPTSTVTKTLTYTVAAPLSSVSLTTSVASPQPVSKTIRLTASKTGGVSVQYQFSASSNSGSTWTILRAYGSGTYKDWTPTTVGDYQLKVAAREGANGTPLESTVASYTITPTPPTAVSLTAGPASPQPINTAVTLTATKTGGTNVEYKFEVTDNGSTWTLLRDFNPAVTCAWTPAQVITAQLRVSARESELPTTVVTNSVSFTATPPLSAVSLTVSIASPQPINKAIRLTATKTGGANVQYQFSASSNGGATWTTLQAYGTGTYKDWVPATAGNYQVKVAAREGSTGIPVESTVANYTISPAPPTAVNLTAGPASPQPINTAVTLTATRTGGTNIAYAFDVSADNGSTWTVLRDFDAGATCSWTPTQATAYKLRVSAREVELPAVVVTNSVSFTATPPLSAVSLDASHASPQPVKKTIKLTPRKTGGANVQYQISASTNNGSTWTVLQSYSSGTYKDWTPTNTGNYQLKVAAREGANGTPVQSTVTSYHITPAPPTAVSLTAGPVSPQPINTAVTLTATKTGGTNVQYKFEVSTDNGATWMLQRDFDTGAAYSWTPTEAVTYKLRVSVREVELPDILITNELSFIATPPLSAVSLGSSLVSPQPVRQTIKLMPTKTGGANVQYQYASSANNGSTWSVLQNWSATAYANWAPSATGNYLLRVLAREGSSGIPVTSDALAFTVVPAPPTRVALTFSKASPQLVNTPITLTAAKTGGTVVEYQFEVSTDNGSTFTTLQDFSRTTTANWQPDIATLYTVKVSARESTFPSVVVSQMQSFTIAVPLNSVTLDTSVASPQKVRTSIKLTAIKTGGLSVKYQFSASSNNGASWSTLQNWSTNSTKTWSPATAGNYLLKVAVREGNAGAPVESPVTSYTITTSTQSTTAGWTLFMVAQTAGEKQQLGFGDAPVLESADSSTEQNGDLSLYFEEAGSTVPGMVLAAQQQWQFVVKRDAGATAFEDIVLTWPHANQLPRDLTLTLVDLATGERRCLRTAWHYVIPSARGASENRFVLIASRGSVMPLHISDLHLFADRAVGTHISYTLTASAQVTLTIRAMSGRVVRRIASPDAQAAGENSLLWDGFSDAGTRLPSGMYQVELQAVDDEENRIRANTIVMLP